MRCRRMRRREEGTGLALLPSAVLLLLCCLCSPGSAQTPTVSGISSAGCGGTSPILSPCSCNPTVVILGAFNPAGVFAVTAAAAAGATGTATCAAPAVAPGGTQITCALATVTPSGRFDLTVTETVAGMPVPHTGVTVSITFAAPSVTSAATPACVAAGGSLIGCLPTPAGDLLTVTGSGFSFACGPLAVSFAPAGPACAGVAVVSDTTLTCTLTKAFNLGAASHAILVGNGIGTSAPSTAATLRYDLPRVLGISAPLCLTPGPSTALSGCSSNNLGVAKGGIAAPGPLLTNTPGAYLSLTGENFNFARGGGAGSPFTTVTLQTPGGGATIACTPDAASVTRTSARCSLAVPDPPGLTTGVYSVVLDNGVGPSATAGVTPTAEWGPPAVSGIASALCPAGSGTLSVECTALPLGSTAVLTLQGTGFAQGYDTCPSPKSSPPCTVPLVELLPATPGPLFPQPSCEVASAGDVSLTSLSCSLAPGVSPPAGVYALTVVQHGVRTPAGSVTFPAVPAITGVDPCGAAATPCGPGDVLTITGEFFTAVGGDTVTFGGSATPGSPTPTCAVASSSLTQLTCTLGVPAGAGGQWVAGVAAAGGTPAGCRDPQLCAVFLRQAAPVVTDVASGVCQVVSPGATAQLTGCSPGQVVVSGANFVPGDLQRNAVVFTPVAGSGQGPAPTCAVTAVSPAGDSLSCTLDVSPLTSGRWALQVDSDGQRTAPAPSAPTLQVSAGNRNPTVGAPPPDVSVCEDSGQFVVSGWIAQAGDGDQNLQGLTCELTPADPAGAATAFTQDPVCVVRRGGGGGGSSSADLIFTSAPNFYGTLYYTVRMKDDGVAGPCSPAPCTPCAPADTCEMSLPYTFSITVLPVNDAPVFQCGGDVSVNEGQVQQSFPGFFSNVTSGGDREAQQILSFDLSTDNAPLFASGPRVVHTQGQGTADLVFTPKGGGACGSASVSVGLSDDNNNLNTFFNNQIALTPYEHTRGTTFVRNGVVVNSCTHQTQGVPCTFRIIVACVSDPPNFLMGPSPVTLFEDSPFFTYARWARNITSDSGKGVARFDTFLIDPFHRELFRVQPAISTGGDLTFQVAPDAHSLKKKVMVGVRVTDTQGLVSCDMSPACSAAGCCPVFEIIITPVNDPPSFRPGPIISVDEDAGALTFLDWATDIRVGPENEGTSSITFEQQSPVFYVEATDQSLFSSQPKLTPSVTCAARNVQGDVCEAALTFTPAPHASGFTKVKVVLSDTGLPLARDGTVPPAGLDGSNEALPQFFTIEIKAVNDAPVFNTLPAAVIVKEDSGKFLAENWVGGVGPGAPGEENQFLRFTLSAADPRLFSEPPELAISGAGMASLSFTPAPDQTGSTSVSVILTDNGGGSNGGVSQASSSFSIVIEPVNDPPQFQRGPDITVLEDSGPLGGFTFPAWATGLSPGGGSDEASQLLEFKLVASTGMADLFGNPPGVSSDGVLAFALKRDAFGNSTVSATLSDNGSPSEKAPLQSFSINVLPVNDAPSFKPGPDLTFEECQSLDPNEPCPVSWVNWASEISPGPPNEGHQRVWFEVTPQVPGVFFNGEAPRVDNVTGTLTMLLAPRMNRASVIPLSVRLVDDGGTENGGVDSASHTAQLLINPVNSAPYFIPGASVVLPEDSQTRFIPGWVKNISAGGPDETGQTLTFVASSNPKGAFSQLPEVNPLTGDMVFRVAPDFNGFVDVTFTLTDGEKEYRTSSMWEVTPVNDPPAFTPGPQVITVLENAGPQVKQWVTSPTTAGPPDEQETQEWWYRIAVETPNLFTSPPVLHRNGTLMFETIRDHSGDAIFHVTAVDNGPPPGTNTSAPPVRVVVRITPVNTDPTFEMRGDIVTYEDIGLFTELGWAVRISAGPGEEPVTQGLLFKLKADRSDLFAVQPEVDPVSGDLNFTTSPDANGVASVAVSLEDSAGGISQILRFNINITAVNDAPSFLAGPTIRLIEDAAAAEFPAWATRITPGPENERGQGLAFTITLNAPELFSTQPALDPSSGTLTWKLAPDANGEASGEACLKDTGGVAVPGRDVDTFCSGISFVVSPVNDPPRIEKQRNVVVNEDAGRVVQPGWALSVVAGPEDERRDGQKVEALQISVSDRNGNAQRTSMLFRTLPSIALLTGDLTFETAGDQSGTADFEILLRDSAGATATEIFTITILPVNDPPDFTPLADTVSVPEDSGPHESLWAQGIGAGRIDELGQSVAFEVDALPVGYVVGQGVQPVVWNITSDLFSVQPRVAPNGVLTFTPAADRYGTAKFRVRARDSGGVERGGVDTTQYTYLTIDILPVNDAPVFQTAKWEVSIVEDAGRQVLPNWATNLSPGPANEASQQLSFKLGVVGLFRSGVLVTEDPASIFFEQPRLDIVGTTATLAFETAQDVWGDIRVTISLTDSAGASSLPRELAIRVSPVNDPPRFQAPLSIDVPEDNGVTTIAQFISQASGGASEGDDVLSFTLLDPLAQAGLFKSPPAVRHPSGDLLFESAEDAFGSFTARLEVRDSGNPVSSTEQPLAINILPVNDPPCFKAGGTVSVPEGSPKHQRVGWVTSKCAGPPNEEASQIVDFVVYNETAAAFFDVPPVVSREGDLTFQAKSEVSGTFAFSVVARDDGGVAHGGRDTSAPQFLLIDITPVNDPPTFSHTTSRITVTPAGPTYAEQWASDIRGGAPGTSEEGQPVDFVVDTSNTALFLPEGQPAVSPRGILSFTASGLIGSSSLAIQARDAGGALSNPPVVITVDVEGYGRRTFILTRSAPASVAPLASSEVQVSVASLLPDASPSMVQVRTGSDPANSYEIQLDNRDLETAFISLAQTVDGMQRLQNLLGVNSVSLKQGVSGGSTGISAALPDPAGQHQNIQGDGDELSTGEIIAVVVGVLAGVALLSLAGVAAWRWRRRRAAEASRRAAAKAENAGLHGDTAAGPIVMEESGYPSVYPGVYPGGGVEGKARPSYFSAAPPEEGGVGGAGVVHPTATDGSAATDSTGGSTRCSDNPLLPRGVEADADAEGCGGDAGVVNPIQAAFGGAGVRVSQSLRGAAASARASAAAASVAEGHQGKHLQATHDPDLPGPSCREGLGLGLPAEGVGASETSSHAAFPLRSALRQPGGRRASLGEGQPVGRTLSRIAAAVGQQRGGEEEGVVEEETIFIADDGVSVADYEIEVQAGPSEDQRRW